MHILMSMTESRQEAAGSPKRRAILEAASELFQARGYGAVSMDAIAKAADVSKATLYAHFESKDSLFATIVQVGCLENFGLTGALPADEAAGSDPETDPDPQADVETALRIIGQRLLRFLLRERTLAIHRLVIAESIRFPELGRAFYDNGPAIGRRSIGAWMARQPGLHVPDPELAAEQFFGLLRSGLYLRATLGLEPDPDDSAIDAVVTAAVGTFLRAFRA